MHRVVRRMGACAGGTDGAMRVFDLREGAAVASFQLAGDSLNGVQFHPFLPLLATASGAGLHSRMLPRLQRLAGAHAVPPDPDPRKRKVLLLWV
jgi:hypothetical protein